ncbi:hypothetical protein J3Q64DRAFT_1775869 [Phycomyces blakesleeanus]
MSVDNMSSSCLFDFTKPPSRSKKNSNQNSNPKQQPIAESSISTLTSSSSSSSASSSSASASASSSSSSSSASSSCAHTNPNQKTDKNIITDQDKENDHLEFALWPNYLCLYLEYALPYDTSMTVSHNLAQLPHCYPNCLSTVDARSISREKCPLIGALTQSHHSQNSNNNNNKNSDSSNSSQQSSTSVVLLAKLKLDLNLNISDFVFNNTFFFETRDRRTIECTTTIYSFGNVVLESKEIQQALWLNEGKYMYSFVFVNQFFDAFMKGIRSLQSWEEVDIAIHNLCIVQVFEDMETKYNSTAPGTMDPSLVETNISPESCVGSSSRGRPSLLSMVYEFERGHGTIDMCAVGDAATNEKFGIGRGLDVLIDTKPEA